MIGKAFKKVRHVACIAMAVAVLSVFFVSYTKKQAQAICVPITIPCISPYSFSADSMIGAGLPDLLQALLDAEIELITNQLMPQFDPTNNDAFFTNVLDRLTGFPITMDPFAGAVYRVQAWFHAWWFYDFWPMLQDRASQLSTIEMDQARQIGSFMDAQDRLTYMQSIYDRKINIHRQHRPDDLSCAVPTLSQGVMRARTIQKSLNIARTREDILYGGNNASQVNSAGRARHMQERWERYCSDYADTSSNFATSGCPAAGTYPRRDIEYAQVLFSRDTIDYTNPTIQAQIEDLKRNIIEPTSVERVPLETFENLSVKKAWLSRREIRAQRNAAYDAFNFMLSKRVPGSGDPQFVNAIHTQAGVNAADFSTNPSYYEMMKVLTSERFKTKDYYLELLTEPENLERELLNLNALGMAQMSDVLDVTDRLNILISVQTARKLKERASSMGRETGF